VSKVGSDKVKLINHEALVDSFSKHDTLGFSDLFCISPSKNALKS
jgi:hypothetical protein